MFSQVFDLCYSVSAVHYLATASGAEQRTGSGLVSPDLVVQVSIHVECHINTVQAILDI